MRNEVEFIYIEETGAMIAVDFNQLTGGTFLSTDGENYDKGENLKLMFEGTIMQGSLLFLCRGEQ